MRFIMLNQDSISLTYGGLIVTLCLLVLVNCRFFVKSLIALILFSIVFFYVDLYPTAQDYVSHANLNNM